jgi:hypothetical protein
VHVRGACVLTRVLTCVLCACVLTCVFLQASHVVAPPTGRNAGVGLRVCVCVCVCVCMCVRVCVCVHGVSWCVRVWCVCVCGLLAV